MATKIIKALVNGVVQNIEVEDLISPEILPSVEERVDILEDKHEVTFTDGNLLVGNGTTDLEEMTPSEVLEHINGASLQVLTTEEYNALGDDFNTNVMYSLSDAEDEFVRIDEQSLTDEQKAQARANINANERTHWVEGGMVEILPETTVALEEEGIGELPVLNLVAGETYVVNWKGTEYSCVAQLPDPSKATDIALGNLVIMGQSDTGEPFVMVSTQEENVTIVIALDGTVSTELTISIYHNGETVHTLDTKYLPESVPYVRTDYCELPVTGEWYENKSDTDGDGVEDTVEAGYAFTAPIGLEVGKTYVVNWNGIEYEVVGLDLSVVSGGELPGVFLGNLAFMGGEDTGEPFVLMELPEELAAETGGVYGIAMSTDGISINIPFSIYGENVEIQKLDNRCLDLEWLPTMNVTTLEVLPETSYESATGNVNILKTSLGITPGKTYVVNFNGVEYERVALAVQVYGAEVTILGNYGNIEGAPATGEPFGILEMDAETAAAIGTPDYRVMIQQNVSEETYNYTISIKEKLEEPNKIPKEFLPDDLFDNRGVTYTLSKSGSTITLTGSDGSETSVTDSDTDTTYTLGSFGVTATTTELNYVGGVTSNIQTQLNNKVDKVSGKGLSTNDYTTSEKTKLSGIEDGANKTIVDDVLSDESVNPVQNKIVKAELDLKPGKIVAGETFEIDGASVVAKNGAEIFNRYESNKASGLYSHAEGNRTIASGDGAHAEGYETVASGGNAHAEGINARAIGYCSHAEGSSTRAAGDWSHTEGASTQAWGKYSHAEGQGSISSGDVSHAEGCYTKTFDDYQHVQGRYNIVQTQVSHIVGNGTADDARSNAHTLDWDGNAWFAGDVYVGSTSGTNKDDGSKKLIPSPSDATAGDLLMYDGTNWVKFSKADLIAEIIAALPSAEEA